LNGRYWDWQTLLRHPSECLRFICSAGEEGVPLVEMYVTAYAESEDAARELLAPYLSCPVAPHKAPHVYKDTWQNMYDVMIAELPDEHHFAVDNAVVSWDSVMDIMQPLADLYRQTPNPKNMIITAGIGYAGPPIDAAFKTPPYRSSYVGFYSLWKPNGEFEPIVLELSLACAILWFSRK
jgi:hypothetical protein